jgi:hypothetical protein
MSTKLVVIKEFNAGGIPYGPGMTVDAGEIEKWPAEAVPNRLANGYVRYEPSDAPDESQDEPETPKAKKGGKKTDPDAPDESQG